MDFVVAVASNVSSSLVCLIKRQLGYVISSESYARDLQKEVGKMAYRADCFPFAVEEARNNVPDVNSHVTEWQQRADMALKEARELLGDFEKVTKTCCYGTLPDPKCRYQFSRKAEGKIEVIKQECSRFKEFANISFSNPAPGNVTAPNPARRPIGWDVFFSLLNIGWDVLKSYVVVPIKRRFEYVISSKSFADRLRDEVRNLENEAQKVNVLAGQARNNLRNFYGYFTEWQQSANEALEEAGDLLADFEKATKTCCHGTLPDPKCRYQFSRQAEGKIGVIKQLAQKCRRFKELNDISFIYPAQGDVTAPNPATREGKDVVQSTTPTASASSTSMSNKIRDDGPFESRTAIITDIMVALADDSNSVVGIHGMGGVGKSTLLVDAERRIREEKQFDWVAKAYVSINQNINNIREEIAHALGLTTMSEKYVSSRADRLRRRLEDAGRKKKKILIILDDLWEKLDLKSVGIPCGPNNKVIGCKLLLASRDRNVLRSKMGCERDFILGGLQREEAKRLFERIVGREVHDTDFEPLMNKSAGLPLLITTVANHLAHDLSAWKDTLTKIVLSKHWPNELIEIVVQRSYDRLDKDMKLFLQLCVLYGGSEPSFENLVKHGVDLGLFREGIGMEGARETLRSGINTLKASSLLLEDGDADDFKIHELVRGFVISVIPRDQRLPVLNDKDKDVMECLRA